MLLGKKKEKKELTHLPPIYYNCFNIVGSLDFKDLLATPTPFFNSAV